MSFWTMPLPGLMRSTSGPPTTYSEFLSAITALQEDSRSWGTATGNFITGRTRLLGTLTLNGDMYGSSWGGRFTTGSNFTRAFQHAAPTPSVVNQQISNSASALVEMGGESVFPSYSAVNRNGYTSLSAENIVGRHCLRVWYWDFSQNKAFFMRPFSMTGPFEWDGSIE